MYAKSEWTNKNTDYQLVTFKQRNNITQKQVFAKSKKT